MDHLNCHGNQLGLPLLFFGSKPVLCVERLALRLESQKMRPKLACILFALSVIATATIGCGAGTTAPSAQLTSIKITPELTTLKVGSVVQFSYVTTQNNGVPLTG